MSEDHACLTLILPRALREELFDWLGEQADVVSGFTASDAAGHGGGVVLPTTAERVKGHADQTIVWVVLTRADAVLLIERLRGAFAGTNLVHWVTPVSEFGVVQ